ncbi:MAG: four helix bundle protein [Armatimonadota bacterium]
MGFRNVIAWQKSIDLVELIYLVTAKLPESERFGLQSQMRRSAVSIPSNIAEGFGRGGTVEYARFIDISLGSLRELQTQIEIAKRLGFIDSSQLNDLTDETARLLYSLRKGVRAKL